MEFQTFLVHAMVLALACCLSVSPTISSTPHNNLTDLDALLSFKSLLTDPHKLIFTNWTTNSSFCSWFGVSCNRHKRVTSLNLHNLPLHGTISPYLANLSFLHELVLANISLVGPIPESLGKLPRLTQLILQRNFLHGPIPPSFFNMSKLTVLYLPTNNLSGSIPSYSNYTLPQLQNISLSFNQLSGDAGLSNFARCKSLIGLSLSGNFFTGIIPNEIGSLSNLSFLYLGGNEFTGIIPTSLGNLTKLKEINLSSCKLTGTIPKELGNLVNLERLSLGNNSYLVGSIPVTLLNNSKLYIFDLRINRLTGPVPDGIGKSLPLLEWFNVGYNELSGGLEFLSSFSNCKSLRHLHLFYNNLEGAIPDNIGNLSSSLLYFDLLRNRVKGNIPSGLGNLKGLIYLNLKSNGLVGNIPTSFSRLQALQSMHLSNNSLSGSIPFELGFIKRLSELRLGDNLFSGSVPESLSNLSLLQHLSLNNNKLSSSIPKSLWTLVNLLELDLSGNSLNGSLPQEVGNLKALTYLNVSNNEFSSNISSTLGRLPMLSYLDLSDNSLVDEIPESFGDLLSLKFLNLSHNSLSKNIPMSLANLSNLIGIDLSYNKLEGQAPKGGIFRNLSISFLKGNDALCGAPQLQPCSSNLSTKGKSRLMKYVILGTIVGVILIIFFCFAYAYVVYRKPETLSSSNEPFLEQSRVISRHELIRATNNFSEVNFLGKGGFGSVFKAYLDDGLVVAVKVLNLEIEDASESFEKECQILGMVRHRNLIKIISVCSNIEFKAIILEFMPKGNLDQWLYSRNCNLSLIQRLNVMVDVALALEYLHHRHPHVILHCDLKPTNVLLDEEFVAHVGDFGVSRLMHGESQSMITASMPGTIGYIAPEYSTGGTISKMGDVYSFGILLLETFTGRKPVDNVFGEESSLREWVFKAYPNATSDIVDGRLIENNVGDLHPCLISVIELGLLCSRNSPKERIPMTDACRRLQKIKSEYLLES